MLYKLLVENASSDYARFSSSLIPGCRKMYGVRIPVLRNIAKKLAKEQYPQCLMELTDDSFEETMLQGFIIGYARIDLDERLRRLAEFVPKIDNWSINDSVCITMKFTTGNRARVWEFLKKYLNSNREFEVRFAVIMLMDFYLTEEYIDQVLEIYENIRLLDYYVMMGVAWSLATAYDKFPEKTMQILQNGKLPKPTCRKAIQKMIESHRVSEADKQILREMRNLK